MLVLYLCLTSFSFMFYIIAQHTIVSMVEKQLTINHYQCINALEKHTPLRTYVLGKASAASWVNSHHGIRPLAHVSEAGGTGWELLLDEAVDGLDDLCRKAKGST